MFLSPNFAVSASVAIFLLTCPVDVRGRRREVALLVALSPAPPRVPAHVPPTADANAAADADAIGPLRRAAATAAATSGTLSMVCVGTKATREGLGTVVPGIGARWGCRRPQPPPPPEAGISLDLPSPRLGLSLELLCCAGAVLGMVTGGTLSRRGLRSALPSPRLPLTGEDGQRVFVDCGDWLVEEVAAGEHGGRRARAFIATG